MRITRCWVLRLCAVTVTAAVLTTTAQQLAVDVLVR
jgi:hypothetical protein